MNLHDEIRQELFIHFEKCVKKHFDFLNDMSYSVKKDTVGWIVHYASEKVTVNVCYGRISDEIDLTLNLEKQNIPIYIEEIIKGNDKRNYFCAVNADVVDKSVAELAKLLKKYGEKFLSGDVNVFESVLNTREKSVKKYDLKLIEQKAVDAWNDVNYAEVVALYQSIKENLTPIQEKRLNLSLKKTNE